MNQNIPLPPRRGATAALTIGFTALILLTHLSVSAAGQKPKTAATANDEFARADTNHDGKLSREEAGDYLVYLVFTARDKNHDDRLTLQEWTRGEQSKVAAFRLRDTNRDGFVTLEEAIIYGRQGGAALSLMRAADKNRDNKLDRAEINAYLNGHRNPAG
jgi:Ca2+-binding EF-hand superfamily protein